MYIYFSEFYYKLKNKPYLIIKLIIYYWFDFYGTKKSPINYILTISNSLIINIFINYVNYVNDFNNKILKIGL